jgi:SAM-dependent methyltransferase
VAERYDPQAFWDASLSEEFTIRGIGFPTFPESLNRHMYRSMLATVDRILRAKGLGRDLGEKSVLDVGSAIGLWIDFWRERGAGRVTGLDITDKGFERLQQRFPGTDLVRADIGDKELSLGDQFDVISAMNMLLHVTDDARWEQALANLAHLLKPDGLLLVMDPIVFHREFGPELDETAIERRRHIDRWRDVLARNELRIERVEPATVLLATPLDARSRPTFALWWFYWRALMKVASGRERVGEAVGWPLQLADRLLIRTVPFGPTSKCLAIRRARP